MNVVIILVLSLCNLVIDIARPTHSLSSIIGLIYVLTVCAFVFLDAIKLKSRLSLIALGILFVFMHIYFMYNLIFRDWDQGVVLFKYTM